MGVRTKPGATQLTRMPRGAYVTALHDSFSLVG